MSDGWRMCYNCERIKNVELGIMNWGYAGMVDGCQKLSVQLREGVTSHGSNIAGRLFPTGQ